MRASERRRAGTGRGDFQESKNAPQFDRQRAPIAADRRLNCESASMRCRSARTGRDRIASPWRRRAVRCGGYRQERSARAAPLFGRSGDRVGSGGYIENRRWMPGARRDRPRRPGERDGDVRCPDEQERRTECARQAPTPAVASIRECGDAAGRAVVTQAGSASPSPAFSAAGSWFPCRWRTKTRRLPAAGAPSPADYLPVARSRYRFRIALALEKRRLTRSCIQLPV